MSFSATQRFKSGLKEIESRKNLFGILFILPPVLFVLLFIGAPALYTMMLSLQDVTLLQTDGAIVGFQNYSELLAQAAFWNALYTGVVFSVGSVFIQVLFGLALALMLNKQFFGSSIARTLAIFPYLVPTIAVATMWQWMFQPINGGIVNGYLLQWGVIEEAISFFGDPALAMLTLIFASSWKYMSFALLIFLARLQAIDRNLYEQAKISGASSWQMFRTITLPQLRSAIFLVLLLRLVWMFNKFDIIWLLTQGGPVGATETLPVFIYRITFNKFQLGIGSAATIVLFLFLVVFASFYFWYFEPSSEVATR
jgi:multiple sugar transport system permease protein